ncbi:MAG: hypothetical protein AB7F74_05100 [Parvibaculaceae bacterium]
MIELLRAREQLYRSTDIKATVALIRQHRLDHETIIAFAGIIAITTCRFDGRGHFRLADKGLKSVVIEARGADAATIVDLIAWPLDDPGRFATVAGFDVLGADQIINPASYASGSALKAFRSPWAWVQAGCRGCVPLHHQHAGCWLWKALGPIMAEDAEHRRELQNLLNPPAVPGRRILVPRT